MSGGYDTLNACALTAQGTVLCWGAFTNPATASTGSFVPVAIPGLTNATQIYSIGSYQHSYACAVTSSSDVICWNSYTGPTTIPTKYITTGAQSLGLGWLGGLACAVMTSGALECGFGSGYGVGNPLVVHGLTGVRQVVAGPEGSRNMQDVCVLTAENTVQCWGGNLFGNHLGDNLISTSSVPTDISGISGASQIAVDASGNGIGDSHYCFVNSLGGVQCWGSNNSKALSLATNTFGISKTPVTVTGLANVKQVAAGSEFTCALMSDGSVQCWGASGLGQFGNGSEPNTSSSVPLAVPGISGASQIVANGSVVCVILSPAGTVDCWGYNPYFATPTGAYNPATLVLPPTPIAGLSGVQQIVLGDDHACVLTAQQGVQCWGKDLLGQLGDNLDSGGYSATPVAVSGLSNVTQLSAGSSATCALTNNGTVYCWGLIADGSGSAPANLNTATLISGLSGIKQIAVGNGHACGITSQNGILCWGVNESGQLGNHTNVGSYSPVNVVNISNAKSVALSGHQSTVLLSHGTLRQFGFNNYLAANIAAPGVVMTTPTSP